MAKLKKAFFCQNCGHQASKWLGQCPSCKEWNTFVEEVIQKSSDTPASLTKSSKRAEKAIPIIQIEGQKEVRYQSPDGELNRVLGGGLVPGSLVLFGGEPGIGKSTLLLQMALQWKGIRVLYVSGEESKHQIKMRAERIGIDNDQALLLSETSMQNLMQQLSEISPDVLIIDSIQTMHSSLIESSAGSISQIRECTGDFMRFAKETNTPVFLIGHINKEGSIAGPKVLEHMVDVVLQFEGDRNYMYRILRSAKNRFGATNEIGIYEMQGKGLAQVENPSEILISDREEQLSGSCIAATLEGMRPMLIEVQALVSSAAYGTPQRSATGFDLRRLNMLLAVLEKRSGFRLAAKDVFLNIAGGIKVEDPAIDLAVVAAVLSSNEDVPLKSKYCFAAEVGLSGEIRAVQRVDQRIQEAEKLGFEKIFISKYNLKGLSSDHKRIELVPVGKIEEVYAHLFG